MDPARGAGGGGAAGRWRAEADRVLRVAAGGMVGGLVAGFVVAGVGGRLAMRVVAIQSPPEYQGMLTDDREATGVITVTGTVALIVFVTILGGLGGLVYAAIRGALPTSRRPLVWAVVTGLVVGSVVIHSGGVDYAVLGSRWVSVAMFGAIAAGYGALSAAVAERVLRPGGLVRRASRPRLAIPFLVLVPVTPVLVVVAVVMAGVVVARASDAAERLSRRGLVVLARAVLIGVGLAAAIDLAGTVAALA